MSIHVQRHLIVLMFLCFFPRLEAQETIAVKVKSFNDIAQSRIYEYPARVINLQVADIAAETQGRILEFPVEVGSQVAEGDTLVTLDCSRPRIEQDRIRAGLKRLRAKKELTQQQLDRAKGLESSRSISRDELDQKQTQLDADNASIEEQLALLESAKKNISDCTVTAPFSGIVIQKMSAQGAYANAGNPMVRLLQQKAVELELELPINQVNILQQAQSIKYLSNQKSYPVSIRTVLPVVNAQSLQQKLRLKFISDALPPGGSFGVVRYETDKNYLPEAFVHQRQGEFGVFLAKQSTATFVILPEAQEGQAAFAPLDPSDLVVISDAKRLRHNNPIAVSN